MVQVNTAIGFVLLL